MSSKYASVMRSGSALVKRVGHDIKRGNMRQSNLQSYMTRWKYRIHDCASQLAIKRIHVAIG